MKAAPLTTKTAAERAVLTLAECFIAEQMLEAAEHKDAEDTRTTH